MTAYVWLWLDDERDPDKHAGPGWTWVKTAAAAIDLLRTGSVYMASLDHDLCDADAGRAACGLPPKEQTGYTVATWMEEHGVWPPGGACCHSQNPVGRARIEVVLQRTRDRHERGEGS